MSGTHWIGCKLNVDQTRVQNWIGHGHLKGGQVGRFYIIDSDEFRRFAESDTKWARVAKRGDR